MLIGIRSRGRLVVRVLRVLCLRRIDEGRRVVRGDLVGRGLRSELCAFLILIIRASKRGVVLRGLFKLVIRAFDVRVIFCGLFVIRVRMLYKTIVGRVLLVSVISAFCVRVVLSRVLAVLEG